MGFPRRGGPAGQCHSWLSLSRHHRELRKLIPLYFTANIPTTATDGGSEPKSGPAESDKTSMSSSHEDTSHPLKELKTNKLLIKRQEQSTSTKWSLVWNIDEGPTCHLHDLMDPVLIYKSLVKSPIHWKCVPQLRSFGRKHCAAVCGVIIRKKRKKTGRLHGLTTTVTNENLHENGALQSEGLPESPVKETVSPDHNEGGASSPVRQTPKRRKDDASSEQPSEFQPFTDTPGTPCKPQPGASMTETNSQVSTTGACVTDALGDSDALVTIEQSAAPGAAVIISACRFCFRDPEDDEKLVRGACLTCRTVIRSFLQRSTRLDDLACLRDVSCHLERPVFWVPTKDLLSKVRSRRLQQEYGPPSEDWCDSCKVHHCLKLGARLADFYRKRDRPQSLLRSINLQRLEDPAFQHRSRERRVLEYLNLLSQDYAAFHEHVPPGSRLVSWASELDDVARFLDCLWVCPLYLPSREHLNSQEPSVEPPLNVVTDDVSTQPSMLPDRPTNKFSHMNFLDVDVAEMCPVQAGTVLTPSSTTPQQVHCSNSPPVSSPVTTMEKPTTWDSFSDLESPKERRAASPGLVGLSDPVIAPLLTEFRPNDRAPAPGLSSSCDDYTEPSHNCPPSTLPSPEMHQNQPVLDLPPSEETQEQGASGVTDVVSNVPSGQSPSQQLFEPDPANHSQGHLSSPPVPCEAVSATYNETVVDKTVCAVCTFRERCDPVDVCIRSGLARKLLRNSMYTVSIGPAQIRGRTCAFEANRSAVPRNPSVLGSPEQNTSETDHSTTFTTHVSPPSVVVADSEAPASIELQKPNISEQHITIEEPCLQETGNECAENIHTETETITTENRIGLTSPMLETTKTPLETNTCVDNISTRQPDDLELTNACTESAVLRVDSKPVPICAPEMPTTLRRPLDCHRITLFVCGPCVLQLRHAVKNLLDAFSTKHTDCVAQLMLRPDTFCSKRISASEDKSESNYCLQDGVSSMCGSCYLYTSLQYLYKNLNTTRPAYTTTDVDFVLPVGGPLFLPHNSPSTDSKSFFERRIQTKLPCPRDAELAEPLVCLCCRTRAEFLSMYEVRGPNTIVCSGCLWTFKAGIGASNSAIMVKRIARRLASAAAATDATVPLLSMANRRMLVDTARLALLISTPCTGECLKPTSDPLWLTCPACAVRRCHRLLPLILPLHPAHWYRRRVKLLTRSTLLEDLDPRLMLPESETSVTGTRKHPHRYSLADVDYTASVIERWLMPPEPPAVVEPCETLDSEMGHVSDVSSGEEDSVSFSGDEILTDSSGFSTPSSVSAFSNHESEYGGLSWWDGEEFLEPTERTSPTGDVDSSETEPETDEARAELVTVVPQKRKRKPSLKASEVEADVVNRKSSRISSKQVPPGEPLALDTNTTLKPCEQPIVSEFDETPVSDKAAEKNFPVADGSDKPGSPKERTRQKSAAREPSRPPTSVEPPDGEPNDLVSTSEAKVHSVKRNGNPPERLIIHGKRKLKINHRFLDDYDGNLSCLTGQGRRIRDESCGSRGSNSSVSSRASGSSILTRRTYSSRASLLAQKRAHACLNNRGRTTVVSRSNAGSSKGRSNLLDDAPCPEEATNLSDKSVEEPSRVCGVGPRVKQISRPAIKSEESRYTSALSAMVHAARLAAVGAKVPGGTSPKHAALAATARSNVDDLGDTNRTDISSMSQDRSPTTVVGRSDFAQSLPDRCGQCPACCGLVQPCGVCNNCRSLQEIDKGGSEMKRRPCKELICFRRRPTHVSFKSGPRVKLPSNFPSNGSGPAASSHCQKASDFGEQQPVQHEFISPTKQQEAKWTHGTVSLLDTVPGLAQQLDCDAWVNQPMNSRNGCAPKIRPKDFFKLPKRANQLEVFSSHPVTPIPGGDLGMRFSGQSFVDVGDVDEDRIRPVEGEVITSELAHHGGYAVVTTMASAPPKEICYACGSGGGQLLFCVSCAEPFHFYCVERQFRPRRKDHFICRNCTECKECRSPAADLRCIRCSGGYHPSCLSDYAPAQSGHRGNWVCPHCASCVHCGSKPLHKRQEAGTETGKPPNTGGCSRSTTAWSSEPNKCAACCSAEARGDICPECDRAYLPTTKQMIQCDTCQLWMHRTCTKLTADEYEWIARLSPGQLNKFIVNCKVCQNELNQRNRADETQGKNTSTSNEPTQRDLGDTDKLQALAHDTLLERMADLVTSCRRSSVTDSSSPTCPPPPPPQSALHTSPQQSTVLSPTVFPPKKPSTGPDPRFPRIPQVDGIVDEDSEDGASPLVQPDSSTYMHIGAHASDVLFYEQNPQPLSDISSFCPLDTFGKPRRGPSNFIRKDKCRTERLRTFSGGSHVTSSARLTPPPICANWVTESEAQRAWTTPRSLVYRILTRILHRLAAHPINSPHAVALRQLLRWLSCTIESLFPWLIVSEMAND
ncbi:hypothetical protein CSKR_201951, partial [Clonorchis sinensis]